MNANRPSGLPDYGYSMQAAAIASSLTQHSNAAKTRSRLVAYLASLEKPISHAAEDFDRAQHLAEFLTDLCRVGSGLKQDV